MVRSGQILLMDQMWNIGESSEQLEEWPFTEMAKTEKRHF